MYHSLNQQIRGEMVFLYFKIRSWYPVTENFH